MITSDTFLRYRRTRDEALRAQILAHYENLVRYVIRRFRHHGEPEEDLRQVAFMALVQAIERYEPASGVKFITFALPTMNGILMHHFRDNAWRVKVPRQLLELSMRVQKALRRGPVPLDALAQQLGVSVQQIEAAQQATSRMAIGSMDEQAARAAGELDEGYETVENRIVLKAALRTLTPSERLLIFQRYFEELSQSQVARLLEVSAATVWRLERACLEKMRRVLGCAPQMAIQ